MQELELGQDKDFKRNKKIYNVDSVQDHPIQCHTYDPVKSPSSPIPRKTSRRTSLEPPQIKPALTVQQNSSQRTRSNSLPRRYSSDCYLNKSDFWTGSLPRKGLRKVVKFDDDQPPARPPPPAPVRIQSLNYMNNNQTNNIYDHDNDEEHKVDLGSSYKDPWVELYGKAVLDNTLQDRIEARRLKALHGSPTHQYVLEQDHQYQQDYSVIRGVVLKVLAAQGIANPSDEVIDNAIKEHFQQQQENKVH